MKYLQPMAERNIMIDSPFKTFNLLGHKIKLKGAEPTTGRYGALKKFTFDINETQDTVGCV